MQKLWRIEDDWICFIFFSRIRENKYWGGPVDVTDALANRILDCQKEALALQNLINLHQNVIGHFDLRLMPNVADRQAYIASHSAEIATLRDAGFVLEPHRSSRAAE